MAKVNISMPDGLLEEIERRAAAADTTRSAFIQEAASHYIATLDDRAAREERADRIAHAADGMARLGSRVPPGEDAAAIIRRLRDDRFRRLERGSR